MCIMGVYEALINASVFCLSGSLNHTHFFDYHLTARNTIGSFNNSKGGELLPAEEEGGKNSSQYFIKYLSRLIRLKKYRKCTDALFTPFLIIEMSKHCLA